MNILYVISSLGIGGAEKIAAELSVAASSQDRTYTIATLTAHGNNRVEQLQNAGIPVIDLNVTGPVDAWRALLTLARFIRTQRPDVVHGWMYHGSLFALMATLFSGRRKKTRVIWSLRSSRMKALAYKFQLWVTITLCHLLSRAPDHITYNSHRGQDEHFIDGFNIKGSSIIPNGVNIDQFKSDDATRAQKRQELGISPDRILIGLIARLDPMKGHATFLEAFSRTHGATAVVVGTNSHTLKPMENVTFMEYEDDIASLLNACDFTVSASSFGEGTSNVILESLSCATPVIATDVGDARRLVENTGVIIAPDNTDELAQAMQHWIDNRAALAELGHAARARAVKYYANDAMLERFIRTEDGHYDVGF